MHGPPPFWPAPELIFTIRPQRASIMSGRTARANRNAPPNVNPEHLIPLLVGDLQDWREPSDTRTGYQDVNLPYRFSTIVRGRSWRKAARDQCPVFAVHALHIAAQYLRDGGTIQHGVQFLVDRLHQSSPFPCPTRRRFVCPRT